MAFFVAVVVMDEDYLAGGARAGRAAEDGGRGRHYVAGPGGSETLSYGTAE